MITFIELAVGVVMACYPLHESFVGKHYDKYVLSNHIAMAGTGYAMERPIVILHEATADSPDNQYWVCQKAGEPVSRLLVPSPKA